jgi:hypothetical protein
VVFLELTAVVDGVHSSVLLYEINVFAVALPVDIENADLVSTFTANHLVVNNQHHFHGVSIVVLLVGTVPSARHTTHRLMPIARIAEGRMLSLGRILALGRILTLGRILSIGRGRVLSVVTLWRILSIGRGRVLSLRRVLSGITLVLSMGRILALGRILSGVTLVLTRLAIATRVSVMLLLLIYNGYGSLCCDMDCWLTITVSYRGNRQRLTHGNCNKHLASRVPLTLDVDNTCSPTFVLDFIPLIKSPVHAQGAELYVGLADEITVARIFIKNFQMHIVADVLDVEIELFIVPSGVFAFIHGSLSSEALHSHVYHTVGVHLADSFGVAFKLCFYDVNF